MRFGLIGTYAVLFSVSFASSSNGQEAFIKPPLTETGLAIQQLEWYQASTGDLLGEVAAGELSVKTLTVPPGTEGSVAANSAQPVEMPIAAEDRIYLTLAPNLSSEEIQALMEERGLTWIEGHENVDGVYVGADLSEYFDPELGDNNANSTTIRGLIEAAEAFNADPRILSAAPDTFQSGMEMSLVADPQQPSGLRLIAPQVDTRLVMDSSAGESIDWGVNDIEADQLWAMAGAGDGVVFGVMDVGFHRHEDLTFIALPSEHEVSDHGNHVAGISCSQHNDVGMRGVLPNCFVRPRFGEIFPGPAEGSDVLRFMGRFSQIMRTLDEFLAVESDAKVYNVSLGYNWASNFGINIDSPDNDIYRQLVRIQGEGLINALTRADQDGAMVVSAAGNDSSGLAAPMESTYASPFNWAAQENRRRGVANALIVEAHDSMGRRARFSNVGGDISCPGVDILSTVAQDALGAPAENAYGTMSGTSMAAPYCAAGAALLMLLRPEYTGSEISECMTRSTSNSDSGSPKLKLTQALAACPPRE